MSQTWGRKDRPPRLAFSTENRGGTPVESNSSPTADRLLRTMIALTTEGEKFPVETLAQIEGDAGPLKLVVTVDQKGSWKRAG